jgi:hypothetical protein
MKYLTFSIPGNDGKPINIIPPTNIHAGGPDALNNIISTGLNLVILGAVIVCLFMLLLGGLNWITSEGDKQKIASARNRLMFSVIGLIIIFISFAIINIIYTFFRLGSETNFLSR